MITNILNKIFFCTVITGIIFQDVNWEITLEEFNRLPHFEQEIITHEEAVFMDMSRKHGEYHVFLYSLDDFYIEAYLFPETGKVAKYKAISEASAYLGGIDITELNA